MESRYCGSGGGDIFGFEVRGMAWGGMATFGKGNLRRIEKRCQRVVGSSYISADLTVSTGSGLGGYGKFSGV